MTMKDWSNVVDDNVNSIVGNFRLTAETFNTVNNISKENGYGNVVRNIHVVGASAFMFLIIIHVVRNIDSRGYNRASLRM